MKKNIDWIKTHFVPAFPRYQFNYRYFEEEGDFGTLAQVEFESERLTGAIDFWGMGWLGILVWDNLVKEEKMNVMISPEHEEEKEEAFKKLQELL